MSLLASISVFNDLGHPFCDNLRNGDWMMGYTVDRLKKYGSESLMKLATWLETEFNQVSCLPRYMIPSYFENILSLVYRICLDQCYSQMSE